MKIKRQIAILAILLGSAQSEYTFQPKIDWQPQLSPLRRIEGVVINYTIQNAQEDTENAHIAYGFTLSNCSGIYQLDLRNEKTKALTTKDNYQNFVYDIVKNIDIGDTIRCTINKQSVAYNGSILTGFTYPSYITMVSKQNSK